jgi:hypothetical protein
MAALYYRPHRLHTGRWAVVHPVPGLEHIAGAVSVDVDCTDQAAAARLADQMNAERALLRTAPCSNLAGLHWSRP